MAVSTFRNRANALEGDLGRMHGDRQTCARSAVSSYLSQSMEVAEDYVGLYVPLLESNRHPILKTVTE